MKNLVSGSSILLVTAGLLALSFGCGEASDDTGYTQTAQTETTDGTCNSIAARAMGTAQECSRSVCEPGSAQCDEAFSVLSELFNDPYCGPAMLNDELNGLPTGNPVTMPDGSSRPGEQKHIGVVLCTVISGCGLCPALPAGFCPIQCAP